MGDDMGLLQVVVAVIVAGLGGGGVASLIKARADRNRGVQEQALSEAAASEDWWQDRMRIQMEAIVEPLRTEVTELRAQVAELRVEVEATRSRYWHAVRTLRTLYDWTRVHLPEKTPPSPHPDIENDL